MQISINISKVCKANSKSGRKIAVICCSDQKVSFQFSLKRDKIYQKLISGSSKSDITKVALEKMFKSFIAVTEKQLSDFLPGGLFGQEPDMDTRNAMKHCKLTNLVSEYEFGALDFSQFRRRNAPSCNLARCHKIKS